MSNIRDEKSTPTGGAPKSWRTEGLPDRTGPEQKSERPKFNWKRFLGTLAVIYLLSFIVSRLFGFGEPPDIPYTEFAGQLDAGNVSTLSARGFSLDGQLKRPAKTPGGSSGQTYTQFSTQRPVFADDNLYATLVKQGVQISAIPMVQERGFLSSLLLALLPVALLAGVWIWISNRQTKLIRGGLGKATSAKPVDADKIRADFSDVAGIDEVKRELTEIVDYLKNPDKYRSLGAKVPKGVLLAGSPGTGKTLLARAVAGEAAVPFFSISAAEFIEMLVGVGASRVRELFAEARKIAPAIIFIDEIDAIGRARGSHSIGGHDEREQTLNQILTEMDGFSGSEGVIVVAATNRPDVLDPALLRPGRFDRTVQVNAPDLVGREAILEVHTRSVPLDTMVDLAAIAKTTPGMNGAELANLVNEAALLAAKRGHRSVTAADFGDALEKIQLGAARTVVMAEDERRRTAVHESGHALLGMVRDGADPVRKVSIIPRGRALGVTLSTPDSDRYAYDEHYLRGRIIGALGGMAAEEVVYGVITTGVESDLRQVTRIARGMVGRWGMSPLIGPLSVVSDEPEDAGPGNAAAPATLNAVDTEVRRIVDECYAEALRILREHRRQLDRLTSALLEVETLDEAAAYAAAGR